MDINISGNKFIYFGKQKALQNIVWTEYRLKFLSLKGGCTGSSESTPVKIPHCWKSHVAAHMVYHVHLLLVLSSRGLIPPMTRDVV